MACIPWWRPTALWLDLEPVEGWGIRQLPWAVEVKGLEKPTAIILLEQYSPELHSNILYLQINVVLTPYQRNFSWQQMQTITENHNQSKCEEQETVVPGPNLYICTQLLHPRLGDHFGRGGQIILNQRNKKFAVRLCLLECQRSYIHEVSSTSQKNNDDTNGHANTEREEAHSWGLNPRLRTMSKWGVLREEIIFPKDSPLCPNWSSNTYWLQTYRHHHTD